MTATVICSLDHGLMIMIMSLTAGLGQLSLLSSMARQNECQLYDSWLTAKSTGLVWGLAATGHQIRDFWNEPGESLHWLWREHLTVSRDYYYQWLCIILPTFLLLQTLCHCIPVTCIACVIAYIANLVTGMLRLRHAVEYSVSYGVRKWNCWHSS